VLGVVAPTVPLMLMDAVPVRLVTTPLEGVPNAGVTSVGLVANTKAPEPVSSVTADARLAELGVARKVAMPVPRPLTPVLMGRPVALVKVALEGVPSAGVTSVGLVANTAAPVPVSSVKAADKLADVNDPSTVAFPVDVIAPVRFALVVTFPAVRPAAVPVMFVPTSAEGVPRFGVTSVGEFDNTTLVVPVLVVTPVPPLATGSAVPDKPIANVPLVVMGEPVIDRNAGTVAATFVTVPLAARVTQVGALVALLCKT